MILKNWKGTGQGGKSGDCTERVRKITHPWGFCGVSVSLASQIMNSIASEDAYKFENTRNTLFFKGIFVRLGGRWELFGLNGTANYNQNQSTICPHFPKSQKKFGRTGSTCWRSKKKKKKINPVLKHSVGDFGRKTAYWADPDLDTLIFGSWPCQSQTRSPRLWIKLFDSSAHRHTKPALSQLLHKSLWNPRMVFVNSAAMRTVPTCQKLMWLRVIGRRESINKLQRKTSHFFGPKNEHVPVKELP